MVFYLFHLIGFIDTYLYISHILYYIINGALLYAHAHAHMHTVERFKFRIFFGINFLSVHSTISDATLRNSSTKS